MFGNNRYRHTVSSIQVTGGGAYASAADRANTLARFSRVLKACRCIDFLSVNCLRIDLAQLGLLKSLESLYIWMDPGDNSQDLYQDVTPLEGCGASLSNLHLMACNVSVFPTLNSLRFLSIQKCTGLGDLSQLAACPSLSNLIIAYCDISDISGLKLCRCLTKLVILNCHELVDATVLGNLERLQKLEFIGCDRLRSADLMESQSIREVVIRNCRDFPDLTQLPFTDPRVPKCSHCNCRTDLGKGSAAHKFSCSYVPKCSHCNCCTDLGEGSAHNRYCGA